MHSRMKILKRSLGAFVILFVLMNVVAFFHAYKFTHFSRDAVKTKNPEHLSVGQKIKTLMFGVSNPRPANKATPSHFYKSVMLQSNKQIACWYIPAGRDGVDTSSSALGTVILFHGYSGERSTMLDKADEFLKMGYNTLVVDFMGSGGSEGDKTTVGYAEAEEVKTAYDHIAQQGNNVLLFGTSMGAAAILKAMNDYHLSPKAVILECPFGSLYETVCARFRLMHVPTVPMASLLVFWGGAQSGFWGFGYKPSDYAKSITCNTLLIYGEQDKNVSRAETDKIYSNLAGPKQLKLIKNAGHENYLLHNRVEWVESVETFLKEH